MAFYESSEVKLYYEVHDNSPGGDGFPLLLIAPGGMQSSVGHWENAPWNPIEQLSGTYKVIAMDQRNAGQSTAPITADDGWHVYTRDQLDLLDHLGVEEFHVAGMCIGGPYCFGLIREAPERVASAVLFQSIGRHENRDAFYAMFNGWADQLRPRRPEVSEATWSTFRESMYGGDRFLFNVDRDFVARCRTPLLVLCGNDLYHPKPTSEDIASLAPNSQFIEQWKTGEDQAEAKAAVEKFLAANTPG